MYAYWGKASKDSCQHHLLVYHCLDVAAVLEAILDADHILAKRFQALVPMPLADLIRLFRYFACLHDLGKFAPAFQVLRRDIIALLGGTIHEHPGCEHHTVIGRYLFNKHRKQLWGGNPATSALLQIDGLILAPLADATFWHHGRPGEAPEYIDLPSGVLNDISQFAVSAAAILMPEPLAIPVEEDDESFFKPASWLFAGLLVLSDWLASGDGFAYCARPMPLEDYWRGHARPQARTAVAASGILCPPPRPENGFHALLPHLGAASQPTPLQSLAMAEGERPAGQRLLLFEDVTGAGKTEAALLAAHALMTTQEASGFFVGLPTMATANSMYYRLAPAYRALFEITDETAPSLVLAHARCGLHEAFLESIGLERGRPGQDDGTTTDSGAYCSNWLADNRKKALLSPTGVGTLDQALLGVLPSTHQCLRLLGIARNVLIADEVHAYDEYTTHLLKTLLSFHARLGGSAILLSATLPLETKQELADAFCTGAGWEPPRLSNAPLPLVMRIDCSGKQEIQLPATRTLNIEVELTAHRETAYARLEAVHRAGGCGLFILNTVDRAMAAHAALAGRIGSKDILLFHARFALADRLDIERRALDIFGKDASPEARRGKILIATQVVEQSLDIDADVVVTELAPMELLIQRAGRCQRHQDRTWRPEGFPRPSLLVVSPDPTVEPGADWGKEELDTGRYVYPRLGVLWRTAKMLAGLGAIDLPGKARDLVEGAYDEMAHPTPAALASSDIEVEGKKRAKENIAAASKLELRQGYCKNAAQNLWLNDRRTPTRLGEEQVTLRLVCATDDGFRLWAGEEVNARTCALSEVSIPVWRFPDAAQDGSRETALRKRLVEYAATLPDKGRFVEFLPMTPTQDPEIWESCLDGFAASYSRDTGLRYLS
ncbi:MAG: CRISPR-associated helicase Cas3' [Desulfovibrionaceae bacterium]|nr:CRISPR-associated helicase Cas3' [Desulfovibrionaceae bacterium]